VFERDPYAAVVQVLRSAGSALTARQILQALRDAGVVGLDRRGWDRVQRQLRVDDHVAVEPGFRYRWVDHPVTPSPQDALAELVRAARGRVAATHIDVIRMALDDPVEQFEDTLRHRQAVLDGVRMVAELASEVEELAVSQASTRAMIHRVRSRVRLVGLEPLERAGESVVFDRSRHRPIDGSIADGAPVLVVRPGYAWMSGQEQVVVARPVVQE
jgi:hypothetical protein